MAKYSMKCSMNRVRGKVRAGAILQVSAFYLLALPNLPTPWLLSVLVPHIASLLLVLIALCFVVTVPLPPTETVRFCEKCRKLVEVDSVHCEECRACVSGLRLHSEWLDCCIGTRNARSYAGVLVGMAVASGLQVLAEGWVATVVMMGGKEGQTIAHVSLTQTYSLQDNGYLYKLALLFTAAISLALCTGSVIHLLRYYGRQRLRQQREGTAHTIPSADSGRGVKYREQGKDAANEQSLVTFCQPVAEESRFEQVQILVDLTNKGDSGKDKI